MNAAAPIKDAHILIVDDDESIVRVLELFLKSDGYANVTTTTKGRFALPLLAELEPDVLVLDLHMPYVSGFELLDELEGNRDRAIPTLVITGDTSPDVRRRVAEQGAELFVKPFPVDDVLETISRMLQVQVAEGGPSLDALEPADRRVLVAA